MYRQVITEAAEAVFSAKGFSDARMSDVALEAGISLKTLYATFSGKTELFQAIRTLRIGEVIALTDAVSSGPALEVMMNRVRVSVNYLLTNPHFLRIHLREGNAWAVRPIGVSASAQDDWQSNMDTQAKIIQQGIDEGSFEPGDPRLLGKLVTAVYQVQLADWLDREASGSPEVLISRIQDFAKRLLCVL
jgi:AcrR family transcriptional regulator